jgi:ribosomal protein S18 acetylase RimI-like enzyme
VGVEDHPPETLRAPEDIGRVRSEIARNDVDSLVVDDLRRDDLPGLLWSGGRGHVRAVAQALDRAERGEVEYLAVRAPGGWPIAIGGVDYTARKGAGKLWQLSTMEELRGLGVGSRLIREAEWRITQRGLSHAVLSVEDGNVRAQALYERLGYRIYGHEQESWDVEDPNGTVREHVAEVTLLEKALAESP